jgi:cbb3-type cytochrome c oxidase subunit III
MKLSISTTLALVVVAPFLGLSLPPQAQKGQAIFQEQCVGCHGADGKAQTDMGKTIQAADLTSGAVQGQSDSKLEKTIKSGNAKMPSFDGKLSDDEIASVVAYIRQIGKGH